MNVFNFEKALSKGVIFCKAIRNNQVRYMLATSLDQCQKKFRGWYVYQVSKEEWLEYKPLEDCENENPG
jgi:hypothetical protein